MLRHIVMVRWRPEAGPTEREAARQAIAALPSQVHEIASLRCGEGIGTGTNRYDFVAVMDFANRDAWERYTKHPAHRAYAEGPGRVAVCNLASIQHEW